MNALDLAQLPVWLGSVFWAMGRVAGLCLVAPVFSSKVMSARVRVGLVVVLTLVLAPLAWRTRKAAPARPYSASSTCCW